ncbi:PLD nuclease N-terminal domain-containing protein [Nocardia cyriacigeorgica]|uniref:Cardiolipin synthase N-terminal domain-containing protein n=1 Tax=Nocardia cyriacigeorgica TaxID=135487 RepID=A0A4U8W5G6_9NOCA|nr:PLD nuclease N-terminal domain-containing protein [Nocardia cyriacigeorgica]MBF6101071.1 PLDc N-terminal domain-containing protein [Nocardia cyriacigeorgica]MBF6160483.1 PLDc N-terminal domain-containing protein [Nocardia cyriacigeorgica]MBF6199750.1 PLDc N-terminal domain-containing protein [Nocardia cyriacigeorgica]MBF6319951.1 PLDc N-terminal domain-containing protein [Nocardia cyriacigeorgica]MBF6517191.1 PLDc N-terminal domain-containing protein [Nocardia cyriacigeorgica]
MSVWEVLWLMLVSFAFIAYLLLLFFIIGDLFRDRETSGWVKAVWIVFLFVLPLLTSLVYLIVRGKGMAERQATAVREAQTAQQEYIRETAGTSPAAQIADARKLLEDGTISQTEFDRLKAKALS